MAEGNVFNMPLATIHVKDSIIDGTTSKSTVMGVDLETGEILASEDVEWRIFGAAERAAEIRSMSRWLRIKGYKTI